MEERKELKVKGKVIGEYYFNVDNQMVCRIYHSKYRSDVKKEKFRDIIINTLGDRFMYDNKKDYFEYSIPSYFDEKERKYFLNLMIDFLNNHFDNNNPQKFIDNMFTMFELDDNEVLYKLEQGWYDNHETCYFLDEFSKNKWIVNNIYLDEDNVIDTVYIVSKNNKYTLEALLNKENIIRDFEWNIDTEEFFKYFN